MRLKVFLSTVLAALNLCAQQGDEPGETQTPAVPKEKIPPAPVLPPNEALKSFKLQPGFRIEVAAAEPLVHDPVQIAFDPDGRLWVLEMRGFMPNLEGNELEKVGSVAVLEDTDDDGKSHGAELSGQIRARLTRPLELPQIHVVSDAPKFIGSLSAAGGRTGTYGLHRSYPGST